MAQNSPGRIRHPFTRVTTALAEANYVTTARATESVQTLADGANIAWNLSRGGQAKVTLGGNRTLDNPISMVAGAQYSLRIIQDGTGSRTLAYGTAYLWPKDVSPTLTTTASATDVLTFLCDGTNMIATAGVFDSK